MRWTALLFAVATLPALLAGCAALGPQSPADRLTGLVDSAEFNRLSEARLRCNSETAARLERSGADPYDIAVTATAICAGHEQAMIRLIEARGFRPAEYQPLIACLRTFDYYDIGVGITALRSNRPGYADGPMPAPDRRLPAEAPKCFAGS